MILMILRKVRQKVNICRSTLVHTKYRESQDSELLCKILIQMSVYCFAVGVAITIEGLARPDS